MLRRILPALVLAIVLSGAASAGTGGERSLEVNKEIASRMMKALQHRDVAAAAAEIVDGYIQHNPNVPTGKAGFLAFFSAIWKERLPGEDWINPPILVTAEHDIVQMTFRRDLPDPDDPGRTYPAFWWDTFRIHNGKIVEHWDPATKTAKPSARP